jgi:membrane protease YdiL (CAAX protease family)
MLLASFSAAFAGVLYTIYLIVCLYVYVSLIRQIAARRSAIALEPPPLRTFGLAETVVALALITWLLGNVILWFYAQLPRQTNMRDIVVNLFLNIGLLLFLVAFMRFRRLDLNSLGGFSRIGFSRALLTGIVLLIAAYPLIILADALTQSVFGDGVRSSRQQIVDLFTGSETIAQRILIIFLAVVVAPIFEEFVFRFFLYGVFKRYLGWFLALALNSLLFALVHLHLPSFVALFVLGSCLTIAYEWSGSILVSMTMHALFNAIMLTLLAFPEIFPQ